MSKSNFPTDPDAGMSTTLAAEYLGGSARTVRRLLELKELDGYRLGDRDWRTTMRALKEFQEKGGTSPRWRHK